MKKKTAVIEKHICLDEDVGLILPEEVEIRVDVSYSFWPDSYGVRGSEFQNGECTGWVLVDEEGSSIKLLEIMIEDPEAWPGIQKCIEEKIESEEWYSEALATAEEDCYEDYDPEMEWR